MRHVLTPWERAIFLLGGSTPSAPFYCSVGVHLARLFFARWERAFFLSLESTLGAPFILPVESTTGEKND